MSLKNSPNLRASTSLSLALAVFLTASFVLLPAQLFAWQITTEPTTTERYQSFLDELMREVDEDQNGFIDSDEKEKCYRPVLENADANQDGLISGQEILDKLKAKTPDEDLAKKRSSKLTIVSESETPPKDPEAWKVKTTVLRLPHSFAQKQVFSLKEIFQKIAVEKSRQELAESVSDTGILVMDQFELEVLSGKRTEIRLSGRTAKVLRRTIQKGRVVQKQQAVNFASHIRLHPKKTKAGMNLVVDLNASYPIQEKLVPENEAEVAEPELGFTPVEVDIKTEVRFEDKNTSAINLYASGHHFLVLFNIEPL